MSDSLVDGLFVVGAAILALVGVFATRGESRLAKELQALIAIIPEMPEGAERAALEERRGRLALRLAKRGQVASVDMLMYIIFGGLLLMYLSISVSQMFGREPEENVMQVVLFVTYAVFTIGAVAFLTGVVVGSIVGVVSVIRWNRDRRVRRTQPVEDAAAPSSNAAR